jgi:hypothetical protein
MLKEELLECKRDELVSENGVTSRGIIGLLEYRMKVKKRHPDSLFEGYEALNGGYYGKSKTSEYFETIYAIDPFKVGSSDTIFNCWSFLWRFAVGKMGRKVEVMEIKTYLDYFFKNNNELLQLFNRLADYQHCLANFMPAPIGFNNSRTRDGKGCYYKDNDFPDLFYKRAKVDLPYTYKWINENNIRYHLGFFTEFNSNIRGERGNIPVDVKDKNEMIRFQGGIINAINCIEKRAESLSKLIQGRSGSTDATE